MRDYPATVRRRPASGIRETLADYGRELDEAARAGKAETPEQVSNLLIPLIGILATAAAEELPELPAEETSGNLPRSPSVSSSSDVVSTSREGVEPLPAPADDTGATAVRGPVATHGESEIGPWLNEDGMWVRYEPVGRPLLRAVAAWAWHDTTGYRWTTADACGRGLASFGAAKAAADRHLGLVSADAVCPACPDGVIDDPSTEWMCRACQLSVAPHRTLPSTPELDAVSVPTSSLPAFVAPPVEPLPWEARPPLVGAGDPLADDPNAWHRALLALPPPGVLVASLPSVPAPAPRTPTPSRGVASDQPLWQRHGLGHPAQDHRGKGPCPLCRDEDAEDPTEEQEAQVPREPSPSPQNGALAGFRAAVLAVSEALDAIRARLDRLETAQAEREAQREEA